MNSFANLPNDLYRLLFLYLKQSDLYLLSYLNKQLNNLLLGKSINIFLIKQLIIDNYLSLAIYYCEKLNLKLPENLVDIIVENIRPKSDESDRLITLSWALSQGYKVSGVTAILAAKNNSVQTLKLLKDNKHHFDCTTAMIAAENNNLEALKFIIENSAGCYCVAAFKSAIFDNSLECIKYLLEREDHDILDEDGLSTRQAAARNSLECLKCLYNNNFQKITEIDEPIIEHSNMQVIDYLYTDNSALFTQAVIYKIIDRCRFDILSYLLNKNYIVNQEIIRKFLSIENREKLSEQKYLECCLYFVKKGYFDNISNLNITQI